MPPEPSLRPGVAALAAAVALALGAAACGDDAPLDPDGGPVTCTTPAAQRYLPLAVGRSWTYDTSRPGEPVVVKTSTVEVLEDVGDRKAGITAYRIRTGKSGGQGDVVSWQEDLCASIVRHREQNFDPGDTLLTEQFFVPGKVRVDETAAHTAMGATWTTAYTEVEVDPILGTKTVSKEETWTVEAAAESVTVPAGTFVALKVRKVTSGNADKLYWFAPGVGKVREEGEQLEELTAFVAP